MTVPAYRPIQDGIDKKVRYVRYQEIKPPAALSSFVHCYWELKTERALADDFRLHALPDACVNILFNLVDTRIAGVTALQTRFTVLNLGKSFHYAGIQLLPGVWQGNKQEIADSFVGTPYLGKLPLVRTSQQIATLCFADREPVLSTLARELIDAEYLVPNVVTKRILANLTKIQTVADMATIARLSPRQLQRALKQTTGFTPHDLLKVLRFQQSFREHYLTSYADQSHFIHSFRKITGYTPARYFEKYSV
jgi:AraC-like DNA-binding protein